MTGRGFASRYCDVLLEDPESVLSVCKVHNFGASSPNNCGTWDEHQPAGCMSTMGL